jgi:hypothetical protein
MGSIDHRLDELRIRQSVVGDLSWESHFGFGEYREGKCFLKGDLLILGEAKGKGIGFLKGEFLEGLRELPPWTTTRYYCLINDLVCCGTGRRATEPVIRRWCEQSGGGPAAGARPGDSTGRAYRLGRYRITIEQNGRIRLQTLAGRNRLVLGDAFLVEGILFLGRAETFQTVGPQDRFLFELRQLPGWNQTEFYSFAPRLKPCAAATAGPHRPGRDRGIETLTGPAGASRRMDRGLPVQHLARLVDSGFEGLARLISVPLKTGFSVLKLVSVITGRAARALRPILAKTGRRAWNMIKHRRWKN